MSEIRIDTLTGVHIGSGRMLYENNDYIFTRDSEDYPVIGILDPEGVWDHLQNGDINSWVLAIENQRPVTEILRRGTHVEDYTLRLINNGNKTLFGKNTLKEQLHDAQGRPCIPGSSIKGAIRTAVLATLTAGANVHLLNNQRKLIKTNRIEGQYFGGTTNEDVFRFLQVGDACFGDNYTELVEMVNINERTQKSYWDTSRHQLVETIGCNDSATFELRLKRNVWAQCGNNVAPLPLCMDSIPRLFETINRHTIRLLQWEIDYWKTKLYNIGGVNDREINDKEKITLYINGCSSLVEKAKACVPERECVLRIGHGSGWRFITGAWTEGNPDFDEVVNEARPNNGRLYQDYDFPKTRRVTRDCALLGFVKLTLGGE